MSRYVAIKREDFENFLRKFPFPFELKQGRRGVYILKLSENVGLAINSTIGEEVKKVGHASIKLNFVSLHPEKFHRTIYGYSKIMAKVVKKKYLQRSKNWEKTLEDAVNKCVAFYKQSLNWFEKIAVPEGAQPSTQKQEVQIDSKIEADKLSIRGIKGWEGINFLNSLMERLEKGYHLSQKQREALERIKADRSKEKVPQVPTPQQNPPANDFDSKLKSLRQLYVTIRNGGGSKEDLEELASIGQAFAHKGSLSNSEFSILKDICKDNNQEGFLSRLASANEINPNKLAEHIAVQKLSRWNRVKVGDKVTEVYHRGIPTGYISKVSNGYEATINKRGQQSPLGVFKNENLAYNAIVKNQVI